MMYKKFLILVSACMVVIGLHADLSVSYQTFQPNDIVIEVGQWKMTAKQLEKYGVESLKVVIVNDGNTDETCVPDRQYLLPYDVYKRLKYYARPSWIKGYGCTLLSFWIVGIALLVILFPQEIQELAQHEKIQSQNFNIQAVRQSIEAGHEIGMRILSTAIVKHLFWFSSSLGISLLIRQYVIKSAAVPNRALFSYIHQEMFFESCKVPAHTSVTKLMFVEKEQDKK